ncbi:MAG TPA: alpha/beta fold hydrolase [Nocardioides sp.]|jgi:pimeloyl-ACP methyl ester carboxylesterase
MTPDGFTHHTTPTTAGRIHYVRGGSGPLLLLLHGWPQTWFEWRRVMPELAGHYTVVAADWRGAGFSGRPAAGYDADAIAAELREVVRPLAADAPITLIGHDWGAVFAYCYAAQYRDEVAALGIFEMALPGLGLMEQAFVPKAGGDFLWHLPFQSVPDIPALLIRGHEPEYLQWFFQHFAYDPDAIAPPDVAEYVRAIRQPGPCAPASRSMRSTSRAPRRSHGTPSSRSTSLSSGSGARPASEG